MLATSDSATFCATCTTLLCALTWIPHATMLALLLLIDYTLANHAGKCNTTTFTAPLYATRTGGTAGNGTTLQENGATLILLVSLCLPRPPIPVLPVHLVPLPQTHALHRPAHNSVRSVLWPPKARRSLATIVHKVDTTRTAKANAVIAPLVGPRCQAAFNARNVKQVFMVLL